MLVEFGEEKQYDAHVFLIYSGIHYDAVTFTPMEPEPSATYPYSLDFDQTQFSKTGDAYALAATQELAKKLKDRRYYTDVSTTSPNRKSRAQSAPADLEFTLHDCARLLGLLCAVKCAERLSRERRKRRTMRSALDIRALANTSVACRDVRAYSSGRTVQQSAISAYFNDCIVCQCISHIKRAFSEM